jgi:hypothetical protein
MRRITSSPSIPGEHQDAHDEVRALARHLLQGLRAGGRDVRAVARTLQVP